MWDHSPLSLCTCWDFSKSSLLSLNSASWWSSLGQYLQARKDSQLLLFSSTQILPYLNTTTSLGESIQSSFKANIPSVTLTASWTWNCRTAAVLSHFSNCSLGDSKQLPSGWKWLLGTQFKWGFKKMPSLMGHFKAYRSISEKVIYWPSKAFSNQTP